jgi:hypothetical protein
MAREIDRVSPIPAPKEVPHYEGASIPLDNINVLNQPRQTFENIDYLAQDIAQKNILNPLTVAELGLKEAQEYIDTINEIWQTQHTIEELKTANGNGKFYILIAGERRLRACKKLDTDGCFDCCDTYGKGPCYERHFGSRNVEVRLMRNFNALEAISTQASENTHMRVPPEEEAHFYDRFYKVRKMQDKSYTVTRFARSVGRSPDTIAGAIRYCKLPDEIQDHVCEGRLNYGMAVELQRAREGLELNEFDLRYWMNRALLSGTRVDDFRKTVSREIEMKKTNQSLLGLFTEAQERDMKKQYIRKVVEEAMVAGNWRFIHYFDTLIRLFEEGQLGLDDSPFSLGSPRRSYKALLDKEEELIPHLQLVVSNTRLSRDAAAVSRSKSLISEIDDSEVEEVDIFPA